MSEPVEDQIRRTDVDGVITVTFTRDRKLNAVNDAMVEVLHRAIIDLGDDEANRALIITAQGRYFTAGKDIGGMSKQAASGVALRRNYRRLHEVFDEIERVEKPVILAAQGPCLGVGVEMGSSCDFRFASPRTTIGLPEIPVLAVLPGSGGISRFTRLVGPHWARWVAMAGENVDAELARTMGWFHHIFPEESFHADVQAWVRKLIGLSSEALGLAKLTIDLAADTDRRNARHVDRMANTMLMQTQEHLDKIAAFVNRSKQN